mgnify:CR=1 FL=1
MPPANAFQHQTYRSTPPIVPYELLPEPEALLPSSADYEERLATACKLLEKVNLAATYLVHGTFTGNDLLGLWTELRRYSPSLSESLRRFSKGVVDAVAGETGNYTSQFAATFQQGLTVGTGREIPVKLFHWSSQNNHIGRADGAISLVCELARLAEILPSTVENARVMLWGHSHGGNVLALLTNLLAADQATRQQFFDKARIFFESWRGKTCDMPDWHQAEQILADVSHPLRGLSLDIVTFGTPIRYGWDSAGYNKLLHFVNHRPQNGLPVYLARHPLHLLRLLRATDGDFIDQLGIAGSNLIPNPLALRTLVADWRLKGVLENGLQPEWRLSRWGRGARVPDEGTTLLVDYHDGHWFTPYHLAGHAAYTRRRWLPFHVSQIVKHFYNREQFDRMRS